MTIHDYDPTLGQAFQGDVSIIPIPDDISISMIEEIAPVDGRLILQEGKVSGHHHAVDLRHQFYSSPAIAGDPVLATRSPKLKRALRGGGMSAATVTARLYRDPSVPAGMVRRGILTRADLAIACLVIDGPMTVTHEEHDGIRLPPGRYLIGRQVESAGAEERIVAD